MSAESRLGFVAVLTAAGIRPEVRDELIRLVMDGKMSCEMSWRRKEGMGLRKQVVAPLDVTSVWTSSEERELKQVRPSRRLLVFSQDWQIKCDLGRLLELPENIANTVFCPDTVLLLIPYYCHYLNILSLTTILRLFDTRNQPCRFQIWETFPKIALNWIENMQQRFLELRTPTSTWFMLDDLSLAACCFSLLKHSNSNC